MRKLRGNEVGKGVRAINSSTQVRKRGLECMYGTGQETEAQEGKKGIGDGQKCCKRRGQRQSWKRSKCARFCGSDRRTTPEH